MTQLQQLFDSWPILFSQYPVQFPFPTMGYFEEDLEWRHWGLVELKHLGRSLFGVTTLVSTYVYLLSTFPPGDSWMQGPLDKRPWDSASACSRSWPPPLLHCHLITSHINLFSLFTFLAELPPHSSWKLPSAGGRQDSWQSTPYSVPKGSLTIRHLSLYTYGPPWASERPWEGRAKPSSLRQSRLLSR